MTPRPETSLTSNTLFTGLSYEIQMMTELKKVMVFADRIDMLVSLIKWSGLVIIINELEKFSARGGMYVLSRLSSWGLPMNKL